MGGNRYNRDADCKNKQQDYSRRYGSMAWGRVRIRGGMHGVSQYMIATSGMINVALFMQVEKYPDAAALPTREHPGKAGDYLLRISSIAIAPTSGKRPGSAYVVTVDRGSVVAFGSGAVVTGGAVLSGAAGDPGF